MPEAEQGMNVARIISLRAALPFMTSAATVNRFCASGLHAVADIAKSIEVGQIGAGVGGGVESMSMIPWVGISERESLLNVACAGYLSAMGLRAKKWLEFFLSIAHARISLL